jgi:hypothetical protein
MNFELEIQRSESQLNDAVAEIKRIKEQLKDARVFTAQFLTKCKKYKITKVSIGRKHDSVESTVNWPFGHEGSVFSDDVECKMWPAIWRVVEEMGISGGCGNLNQHNANTSRLIDGVYHLKDGKWMRVE